MTTESLPQAFDFTKIPCATCGADAPEGTVRRASLWECPKHRYAIDLETYADFPYPYDAESAARRRAYIDWLYRPAE